MHHARSRRAAGSRNEDVTGCRFVELDGFRVVVQEFASNQVELDVCPRAGRDDLFRDRRRARRLRLGLFPEGTLPAIGRAAPHERGADECGRRTKLEAHGPFHFLNVSSMCGLPARAGEERIPMVAIGCRLVWVESHA